MKKLLAKITASILVEEVLLSVVVLANTAAGPVMTTDICYFRASRSCEKELNQDLY